MSAVGKQPGRRAGRRPKLLMAVLLSAAFSASEAEIVLQTGTTLQGAMTVSGDVGARAGRNLFHTFSVFNVLSGESATYTLPTGAVAGDIGNVLSRVTGGTSTVTGGKHSFIAGPISGIAGASFWFINPNGIVFGNGAALNSASSFHFSTADFIRLDDGTLFNAVPAPGEVLTAAPPAAFGFLTSNPAAITVATPSNLTLRPPPGATLSLVGGPINVGAPAGTPGITPGTTPPGFIFVNSGRLNLVSVASAGEATFDGRGFNVDAFPQLGDVNIKFRSAVDAREVFIRGGRLTIDDSLVMPGLFSPPRLSGVPTPDGGEVNIKVTGAMTVTGQSALFTFRPGIYTFNAAPTTTPTPTIPPPRDVPDIHIQAGSISVTGVAGVQSERFAPGNAADVAITTDSLEIRNGASVAVNNFFEGPGGTLTVNARNVELSGDGNTGFTGIAGQSGFNTFYSAGAAQGIRRDPRLTNGDGATVNVNASGTLTVRRGAEISTDSFAFGRAGDLNVQASDIFLSTDGAATGKIASQSLFAGPAGNLKVTASGRIAMSGGFQISGATGGTGDGGKVDVTAGQSISIDGANTGIVSVTVRPPQNRLDQFANRMGASTYAVLLTALGLPANADIPQVLGRLNTFLVGGVPLTSVPDLTIGDAGRITVATPSLSMSNGARIDNSTAWAGNAGEILVNVGSLDLVSGAKIRSQSGLVRLPTGVLEVGSGDAGNVTVNASDVTISGSGSGISTSTFGDGDGGAIAVTASNVTLTGGGTVDSSTTGAGAGGAIMVDGTLSIAGAGSGLFSTAKATGDAGQIALSTPALTLADGGRISVTTEGAGNAGTIVANVGNFSVTGGSRVDSSTSAGGAGGAIVVNGTLSVGGAGSGLFSTASSTGNAGAITVTAPSVTVAGGGRIDSSTTAGGAGGAIIVNATLSIDGAGSGLFSTASNTGNAGAIAVTASNVTLTGGGTVDSSTTGAGAGGAINLSAASQFQITSGGSVRADSLGSGLTGNITISAGDQIVMQNGSISTRAVTSDGGDITLRAPRFVRLEDSQITTSVASSTGRGGNIFIDPQFVILQRSTILANAFGGPGGNITIIADNFLPDVLSLVEASSALSTPGTILIRSPENNLKAAIAQLPGEFVDASRLMRAGCAARHTGATSSLAVAGRGGVPADADGYLPSFSTTGAPLVRAARQEERGEGFVLAMASWDCLR